jgi:hypothetical protein
MNKNSLAVGLGMVLVMAVALGSAEAKHFDLDFYSEVSGSYVSEGTRIDTDKDGRTADLDLTSGKSNHLGEITTQDVAEWPSAFSYERCPNGQMGYKGSLVSGFFVIRSENGDLLFGKFTAGTNCFDFITNSASISLEGGFTGGTGRFAGASGGSLTISATATPLMTDEYGHQFGSVVARTHGTLPHPHHGMDDDE